jgi:hypothetical protein
MLVGLEEPDLSAGPLDLDGHDLRSEAPESILSIARPWL